MGRALIVSAGASSNEYISARLTELGYARPIIVPSAAEARRRMLESDFELIVVNSPLPDEFGHELCADAVEKTDAGVIFLAKAAAAEQLAQTSAFAGSDAKGIRDASLMLDGVGKYNAEGFERAFIRISDALAKGDVTDAQYKTLFDTALDIFNGVPEETRTLIDSMTRLRDAMRGFADGLLIDEQRTTLSASATLAEMQRQYAQAFAGAATGDSESISKYQQLANTLLDKELYRTQAEYNAVFGSVYGDARQLEAIGVNTVANAQGDEMVAELKDMNAKLNKRVEDLEKNLMEALAQIAKNT